MHTVSFILVPDFAEQALIRNMRDLSKLTSFPVIRQVLSINDIVTIVSLQKHWNKVLGLSTYSAKNALVSDTSCDLLEIWRKSCISDEDKMHLNHISAMSESLGQEDVGVSSRYFTKNEHCDAVQDYEIHAVGPALYGVSIKTGVEAPGQLNKKLLRDMMEKMSTYMEFNEIASTNWFSLYLNSL